MKARDRHMIRRSLHPTECAVVLACPTHRETR
jgi:hypothetical protein